MAKVEIICELILKGGGGGEMKPKTWTGMEAKMKRQMETERI